MIQNVAHALIYSKVYKIKHNKYRWEVDAYLDGKYYLVNLFKTKALATKALAKVKKKVLAMKSIDEILEH